jgi:hypothetical protein
VRYRDSWAALAAVGALVALGCEQPEYCTNSCRFAQDGQCDEGTYGAASGYCARGTDCADCGPNDNVDPGFQLERAPQDPPTFEYREAPGEAPPGLTLSVACDEGAQELCAAGPGEVSDKIWRTNDGCVWGWYQCPGNPVPIWPDTPWQYWCREDGPNGIGCYYPDAAPGETHWDHCTRVGFCTCEDGARFEQEIEHCHRSPVFYGPSYTASCSTWYQVGEERHECGTWQCSPHGAPVACDLGIAEAERLCGCGEVEPPPPISPMCASIIESTRASYEALRTSPCASRCVDGYLACIIRGDCMTIEACGTGYSTCLRGCT